MTAYRGLYVKGTSATPSVGTTPLEARLVSAGHIAENSPGVPRVGVFYQTVTNLVTATATTAPLTYNIAACNIVMNRVAGEGVYEVSLVGTTVANTIAPPAANSRWDLIYVAQNDPEKGDPDNSAVVGVVNGVAAAAPVKPYSSVPAGALVLAEAQIFSGTTATNGGTNSLAQVWLYTALRGAPIPVRTQAERDAITLSAGLLVRRLDLNGGTAVQSYDGTYWRGDGASPFGHMGRTQGFQAVNAGAVAIVCAAAQDLRGGMTFDASSAGRLVIPRSGYYHVRFRWYATGAAGQANGAPYLNSVLMIGPALVFSKPDGADYTAHSNVTKFFNAGDKIGIGSSQAMGAWGTDGYNGCWVELEWQDGQ